MSLSFPFTNPLLPVTTAGQPPRTPVAAVAVTTNHPETPCPEVNLSSIVGSPKRAMPIIGFGTGGMPSEARQAVIEAIEIGYRHFDTAPLYRTEKPLGEGIAEALRLGLIKSRDELFVTSKLWSSDGSRPPCPPADIQHVWEAMEECQRLGLTKSIGVSNFSCKKLDELLAFSKIPPAVNQVCMGWLFEQGVNNMMKSFKKERMKENIQIFDWELSDEEKHKINQIPHQQKLYLDFLISEVPHQDC